MAPEEEGASAEVLAEAAPEYPVDPEPEPEVEPLAAPLPADQRAEGDFHVPDGYAILEGEPRKLGRCQCHVHAHGVGRATDRGRGARGS